MIDWQAQVVTCPQGKLSQSWQFRREKYGHLYIQARFAPPDCRACPYRLDCTKSKRASAWLASALSLSMKHSKPLALDKKQVNSRPSTKNGPGLKVQSLKGFVPLACGGLTFSG
ncbi:MAG: transposase [Anaerolineales bacterium]|nr:transposase [Anaerolineales bacterium]